MAVAMEDKPQRSLVQVTERKLHSLIQGLESAIQAEEWEKALGLGLCLLGFIESECRTDEDRRSAAPIKCLVLAQVDLAKAKHYKDFGHVGGELFARLARSKGIASTAETLECAPVKDVELATSPAADTAVSDENTAGRKRERNAVESSFEAKKEYWKQKRRQRYSSHAIADEEQTKHMDDSVAEVETKSAVFVTAKQKLAVDSIKKNWSQPNAAENTRRCLGVSRRTARSSFISPFRSGGGGASYASDGSLNEPVLKCLEQLAGPDGDLPDKLRNLEPSLLEHISNEIMEKDTNVRWDDIAGLHHAKKSVTEMVIWPLMRPDLFHGCRSPEKGLLLFGPPGTGKTMIGKAIAGESKATFFSISASSLTSKWIGEGEKLVRALFGVASCLQPAVIFIDEIDSLLSQRKSEGEHESSRRIKTQFLIEMEGIGCGNERVLLIGATNRPQELDEAARRRFSKRLYIPLPTSDARAWIVRNLLRKDGLFSLSDSEVETVCSMTDGYSGSDMKNLVKEASMFPLREALKTDNDIGTISQEELRPIGLKDFMSALQEVKPSVSKCELGIYEVWNSQFGSFSP